MERIKTHLSPELMIIFLSAKINLSSNELSLLELNISKVKDWENFCNLIINCGLSSFFYTKIQFISNSDQIPLSIINRLKNTYYKILSRNIFLLDSFKTIVLNYSNQNIEIVALKGILLGEWLYKDLGLRHLSDIDILIKGFDSSTGLEILDKLGYKKTEFHLTQFEELWPNTIRGHYFPSILNGVIIELHIKLEKQLEIDYIWESIEEVTINGLKIKRLSLNDLIIHTCTHLDKHYDDFHPQFTSYADLTNILSNNSDKINWKDFIDRCRLFNIENLVFKYLIISNKFFFAKLPESIIDAYSYLVTIKDELLLIHYLEGLKPKQTFVLHHVTALSTFNSKKKIKYLVELLFPTKLFMVNKYSIKNPAIYYFYYPYRWWIGLNGLVQIVMKKNK